MAALAAAPALAAAAGTFRSALPERTSGGISGASERGLTKGGYRLVLFSTCTSIYVCMYTYIYIYIYIHTYDYIHISLSIYLCLSLSLYIYIYLYIYI